MSSLSHVPASLALKPRFLFREKVVKEATTMYGKAPTGAAGKAKPTRKVNLWLLLCFCVSYRAVPFHAVPCHSMSCRAVSLTGCCWCSCAYRAVLCYAVLCPFCGMAGSRMLDAVALLVRVFFFFCCRAIFLP